MIEMANMTRAIVAVSWALLPTAALPSEPSALARNSSQATPILESLVGEHGRGAVPGIPPARELAAPDMGPEIPNAIAAVYQRGPGGSLKMTAGDPVALRLHARAVELFALRHGESEANRDELLAGSGTDSPLTRAPGPNGQSGLLQAESAALAQYEALGGDSWALQVLAGKAPPAWVLYSPLIRTRETAAVLLDLMERRRASLAGASTLPIVEARPEPALREMSFGELDGKSLAEASRLPGWNEFTYLKGSGKAFFLRFPGTTCTGAPGESGFDVILRQRAFLDRVAQAYAGRKVVLISHAATIIAQQAIFGLLSRDPSDGALRARLVPNAVPIRLSGSP